MNIRPGKPGRFLLTSEALAKEVILIEALAKEVILSEALAKEVNF